MKIFISHKNEDSLIAKRLDAEFKLHGINTYLDVIDEQILNNGKALTEHIKNAMSECSDIIVVMSEKTKNSQWVPFEVGMSAQRDMPTVTFLIENVKLPEFLEYWPRLKDYSDVKKFIIAKKQIENRRLLICENYSETSNTEYFYRLLKEML
ncbi:MAG: toll/interleukin-1 receptor domain-containing protein [Ruminococcus flavefaciens]|nr:toll/interleukin-1 receptor domain-containing protein [Ruminococcus flavefaciens]